MREFVTNFQKKHGQKVPMPAIYGDEDSSDSEGLELADGTKVGKKTTGGSRGDDPGCGRKRGRDDGGDGGDPNKCRKTGDEPGPSRPTVAHKEPRKVSTTYPPINRRLPVLYISHKKERTCAGPSRVGLDSGAEEEDT